MREKIKSGIYGVAVGDAMGLPVEFKKRSMLKEYPVTSMIGDGTYSQVPGTWSDDTSLTLCLVDSLSQGKLDYQDIIEKFCSWMLHGEYTPFGRAFDIGIGTCRALIRYGQGYPPLECGGVIEQSNGNGSLMRSLPISYYIVKHYDMPIQIEEVMEVIHNISKLTHAHIRSQIACGIYILIAVLLLRGEHLDNAIKNGMEQAFCYYEKKEEYRVELEKYARIYEDNFSTLPEEQIKSSGYVVDTLEAALWCIMNTNNYRDCILKAVNLGGDTDTIAAVAGGLAGIAYEFESIPKDWINELQGKELIDTLCEKFQKIME